MLPDSGTNYEGSMGFVSFRAKPVAGLPYRTEIYNQADIYFDYNDAVITNRVLNTIDNTVTVQELESGHTSIRLLPNPFREFTTLKIEGAEAPYRLKVFDVLGKLVRNETADRNIFTLERETLASGMYMFEVWKGNQVIGKGKMIAE